ncbi:MAG: hypothetical protein ABJB61_03630 [bacterium]
MDRNQKIAIGCGGAGCLGLIAVVVICVVLFATGYINLPGRGSEPNENFNASNSNSNSNVNENSNSNSSSSSSLSDDDKHKLFQAAGMTQDNEVIQKVLHKLGFLTASNEVSEDYAPFVKGHMAWATKNYRFVQSVSTKEKARAYVDAHIND